VKAPWPVIRGPRQRRNKNAIWQQHLKHYFTLFFYSIIRYFWACVWIETIFLRDETRETRRNASHLLLPGTNRIINNMACVKHVQTGAHLEKLAKNKQKGLSLWVLIVGIVTMEPQVQYRGNRNRESRNHGAAGPIQRKQQNSRDRRWFFSLKYLKSMVYHKHDRHRHTCFCYYKNPQKQTFIWSHNSDYFSCVVQITEEIFSVYRSHRTIKDNCDLCKSERFPLLFCWFL
jgi:hypothetical protein